MIENSIKFIWLLSKMLFSVDALITGDGLIRPSKNNIYLYLNERNELKSYAPTFLAIVEYFT